jgi:hypothetical protein
VADDTAAQPRLYVLLARRAPRAVIFRRGPSKSVLMIAWDTERDQFVEGQWLQGRLYERRCDLSPGGELLVYFAAKYKRYLSQLGREVNPFPTWTAVSRPPYFTALSLWPHDDAYNGGGLFDDDRTLRLNHGSRVTPTAPGLGPPPPHLLEVQPLGGPCGEDNTVQHRRLVRDGWTLTEAGKSVHQPMQDPHFLYQPPTVYSRRQPRIAAGGAAVPRRGASAHLLHRRVLGMGKVNGPWYVEEFLVESPANGWRAALADVEWADWDRGGDLLFAREGALYRVPAHRLEPGLAGARQLADFSDRTFRNLKAPPDQSRW